jgi:hypothetical protein
VRTYFAVWRERVRASLSIVIALTATLAPAGRPASAQTCQVQAVEWADGSAGRTVCVPLQDGRRARSVVDLSDGFAPRILSADPRAGAAGEQPYRATYLALADERWDALPEDVEPEHYLELFGISPTFRVLRARLADEPRHRCHDAVEDRALGETMPTLRVARSPEEARTRIARVAAVRVALEQERVRLGLGSIDELDGATARPALLARYREDTVRIAAITAAQEHLACDGLLEGHAPGVLDGPTSRALAAYQRMHARIGSGVLDESTREVLRGDSREAVFLAILRALRERIVDATGAIEDGSALGAWDTVLGRALDAPEMRTLAGHEPIAEGAPDWVSSATEAAARALGWTSPRAALEALADSRARGMVVVSLPPRPHYHAAHMDLRVEIDRGDVWYDYPYTPSGTPRARPIARRPMLTLYARTQRGEIALVRWPTTIGGWQEERLPGGAIRLRYKESPAGMRLWRDVVASPAWLPPSTTPDRDLVRRVRARDRARGDDDRWALATELVGPSYRSAYGLVMIPHVREIDRGDRRIDLDEGVRTHGSASYGSILRGESHGCHRLWNHLAVRLGSFLLAHRSHVRHGPVDARFSRRVVMPDRSSEMLRIASRGVRFELDPPVPVEVLDGRVVGRVRRVATRPRPLRESLLAAARSSEPDIDPR